MRELILLIFFKYYRLAGSTPKEALEAKEEIKEWLDENLKK